MPEQIAHDTPPQIANARRTLHVCTILYELREAMACESQAESPAPWPGACEAMHQCIVCEIRSSRGRRGTAAVSVPHTSPVKLQKHSDAAMLPCSTPPAHGELWA